jgi:hypothetical protein
MRLTRSLLLVGAALSAAACRSDAPADAADSVVEAPIDLTDAAARQQRFVDSVLASAKSVEALAAEKGTGYGAAPETLESAVLAQVEKTRDCYTKNGREIDPTLAGVVTFLVNRGAIGFDVMRVESSTWTSAAGSRVDACFNDRAPKEWKLEFQGVPNGAHLVRVEFKPDAPPGAPTKAADKATTPRS